MVVATAEWCRVNVDRAMSVKRRSIMDHEPATVSEPARERKRNAELIRTHGARKVDGERDTAVTTTGCWRQRVKVCLRRQSRWIGCRSRSHSPRRLLCRRPI